MPTNIIVDWLNLPLENDETEDLLLFKLTT